MIDTEIKYTHTVLTRLSTTH